MTETTYGPLEYNDAVERLAKDFGDRALKLLREIAELLTSEGFTLVHEPSEMFGDDYRWSMVVRRPDAPEASEDDLVDLTVELAEADEYEGDDARGGINWGLDIVEYGGRILGGLTPFNYTDKCWVPMGHSGAVEERFAILEAADISDIPSLCEYERTGGGS